jgi:uncharacterized protein DUF4845
MQKKHSTQRKQRGVTMIGWIFLLIPMAIVLYAGIRLAPIYLNYGKVVRVMDRTAEETHADDSLGIVHAALEKRLDIEIIEFPDTKDFTIKREGPVWVIDVNYEDRVPMVGNVSLVVNFQKTVRVGKASE